jgi:adenylate cyclase
MHGGKMAFKKITQLYLLLFQLLFDESCMRVEKIKVAGWTYMAACGLDPGRRDSINSINRDNCSEHVVLVLTRFAAKMMGVLEKINRETFQTFKLRVGQLWIHAFLLQTVKRVSQGGYIFFYYSVY